MNRYTVVLQKNSAKMVKYFPILGRYEQLQPLLFFPNMTGDTSTCFSIEVHAPNQREASLAPTSQPRRTASPLFNLPAPRRAARFNSTPPASPASSEQLSHCLDGTDPGGLSEALSPFCSHWNGPQQGRSETQVTPHTMLSSLSHNPLFTQVA